MVVSTFLLAYTLKFYFVITVFHRIKANIFTLITLMMQIFIKIFLALVKVHDSNDFSDKLLESVTSNQYQSCPFKLIHHDMYKVSKDISSKMIKWINDKWQNALTVIKKDAKLPFGAV